MNNIVTIYTEVEIDKLISQYAEDINHVKESLKEPLALRIEMINTVLYCVCTVGESSDTVNFKHCYRTFPEGITKNKSRSIQLSQIADEILKAPKDFIKGTIEIGGIAPDDSTLVFRFSLLLFILLQVPVKETIASGYIQKEDNGLLLRTKETLQLVTVSGKERPDLKYGQVDAETGEVSYKTGRIYPDEISHEGTLKDLVNSESFSASKTVTDPETGEKITVPVSVEEGHALRAMALLAKSGEDFRKQIKIICNESSEPDTSSFGLEDENDSLLTFYISSDSLLNYADEEIKQGQLPDFVYKDTRIELTDTPLTAVFSVKKTNSNRNIFSMKLYNRILINMFSPVCAKISMVSAPGRFLKTGEAELSGSENSQNILFSLLRIIPALMNGLNRSQFFERHEVPRKASGILITQCKENNCYRVVTDKLRPDLIYKDITGLSPYHLYTDEDPESIFCSDEKWTEAADGGDYYALQALADAMLQDPEQKYRPQNADNACKPENQRKTENILRRLEQLAETGNPKAQLHVALTYLEGTLVASNLQKAAFWLAKAVENGAKQYSVLAEQSQAAAEAEKRAEEGDPDAMALLAKFLLEQPDPKHKEHGFRLAEDACERSADAGLTLARCYCYGNGTEKDGKKAKELLRELSQSGSAEASYELGRGILLQNIPGTPEEAVAELTASANGGSAEAMKKLGKCYETGTGCEKNTDLALSWYNKAYELLPDDKDLEFDIFMLNI